MQQIRWALIVVASVAVIAMGGCGHNVHVQFNNGRTRVHVGSQAVSVKWWKISEGIIQHS